uniref:Uncharacterized protein n=1 Tax=Nelumbo nucifera TaxID=4432 RepID=A0A822YWY7_NELNU|nr:TPA_asm: hypothetical protein HUJ06_007671 [Nelumbo nucifera]
MAILDENGVAQLAQFKGEVCIMGIVSYYILPMFLSTGEKISSTEVDAVLLSHLDIAKAGF